MNEPTHLDIFSGIGGFALAAEWAGFRTIGFCEIDKYCQKVLAKNFVAVPDTGLNGRRNKPFVNQSQPQEMGANLTSDIFDLDGRDFYGVTLITGGFPCQPFSVAGKRRGAADDRHLWPEMLRVIKEATPAWVLSENVPGIIPMELDNVLSDLESIGYATRAFVIPACAVDARHRRDRVWIVGYGQQQGLERHARHGNGSNESRWNESGQDRPISEAGLPDRCTWLPEPAVCELADGLSPRLVRYAGRVATKVPNRVQKLKGLGNAIVPQVAYEILHEIRKMI